MKRLLCFFQAAVVVGMLFIIANVAGADDGFQAPEIAKGNYWGAIGVSILAAIGIGIVAFKNPHRTHLD